MKQYIINAAWEIFFFLIYFCLSILLHWDLVAALEDLLIFLLSTRDLQMWHVESSFLTRV